MSPDATMNASLPSTLIAVGARNDRGSLQDGPCPKKSGGALNDMRPPATATPTPVTRYPVPEAGTPLMAMVPTVSVGKSSFDVFRAAPPGKTRSSPSCGVACAPPQLSQLAAVDQLLSLPP